MSSIIPNKQFLGKYPAQVYLVSDFKLAAPHAMATGLSKTIKYVLVYSLITLFLSISWQPLINSTFNFLFFFDLIF